MSDPFNILSLDEDLVAIEKPAGFHVHQPEFPRRRVPDEVTCLSNLRRQIQCYVYPVHRIDVATEGVLIFALNRESAASLCRQFQAGEISKTYFAVVRGWTDDQGEIDLPLELDSTGVAVESFTRYRTHTRIELPYAVGKRHSSARYSLVEARPETGRFHQIRRHFARLSHPLIGDAIHGDSHHNRFFRAELGLSGLWLKALSIEFHHPRSGLRVSVDCPWGPRWQNLFRRLEIEIPVSREAEAGDIVGGGDVVVHGVGVDVAGVAANA